MYEIVSLVDRSLRNIIDYAELEGYHMIVDLREIHSKSRKAVSPYDLITAAYKKGLLVIDQLVFGIDLSVEVKLELEDDGDWWINAFYNFTKSMNVLFLTAAPQYKIRNGNCLAAKIINRIKLLAIREKM